MTREEVQQSVHDYHAAIMAACDDLPPLKRRMLCAASMRALRKLEEALGYDPNTVRTFDGDPKPPGPPG